MAIRTGIIGKEARTLLPGRERKKVAAVLAEKVVPAMQSTLPGQLLPAHYPWCFILPPLRKKGRFYVGALVNSRAAGLRPFTPPSACNGCKRNWRLTFISPSGWREL